MLLTWAYFMTVRYGLRSSIELCYTFVIFYTQIITDVQKCALRRPKIILLHSTPPCDLGIPPTPSISVYSRGIQEFAKGGGAVPALPYPSFLFPSFSFSTSPLEVGPFKPEWVWRSAVSSPSGVRGRAPAENEFGAL